MEALFAGRPVSVPQILARLRQVAAEEGLPLGRREKTYNSRRAQELGKWAESQGTGEAFHNAVFRAYFADGLNIAQISTLVEVGTSVGLPAQQIRDILETRAFKEVVDRDWSRAYNLGITAVPTFVMNRQSLVGAQPYEVLAHFMNANDVKRRG